MTANAQNIVLGKGNKVAGTLLRGPSNASDLPTDAKTPAPATFADHGLIGSDGIKLTIDKKTDTIKDMNGDAVRTVTTEFATSIEVPFLELNEASLKAIFGDGNVTMPADPTNDLVEVRINSDDNPPSSWVINLKDGTTYVRVVVGSGTAVSTGDIKIVGTDAIILPLLISPMPDANGDHGLIYKTSPKAAAPAAWQATHAYSVNDLVTNSTAVLKCTTAGTSGSTAPTNPSVGGTVTDGTVTWTRQS